MNRSVFSIIVLILASNNLANAQLNSANTSYSNARAPYRYTGGWKVSPQNPASQGNPAVVQSAFFQDADSQVGYPAIPGGEVNNVNPMLQFPSSMPNALSDPAMANRQNDFAMNDNVSPNMQQEYQPNNQTISPPPMNSQFDAYAREQSPFRTASSDLRAVTNQQNPGPNSGPNPGQVNQGNDLRPIRPTMQQGFGPNARTIEVATGYPFVSPAPGNYPTSQYRGPQNNGSVFRPIAYQNVVQSPQAPLSAVADTPPTLLPQNAPVGSVPTQYQCAPAGPVYPPAGMVPGTYVPPTLTPNLAPGAYSPNNSGYTPFFSLGQENYNVQLGRGIIGQPTVYVPGQPIRNFMRYLSP